MDCCPHRTSRRPAGVRDHIGPLAPNLKLFFFANMDHTTPRPAPTLRLSPCLLTITTTPCPLPQQASVFMSSYHHHHRRPLPLPLSRHRAQGHLPVQPARGGVGAQVHEGGCSRQDNWHGTSYSATKQCWRLTSGCIPHAAAPWHACHSLPPLSACPPARRCATCPLASAPTPTAHDTCLQSLPVPRCFALGQRLRLPLCIGPMALAAHSLVTVSRGFT